MDSKERSTATIYGSPPGERAPSSLPAWLPLLSGLLVFSPLLEGGTTHVAVMIIRLMILALVCLYLWEVGKTGAVARPSVRIGAAVVVFLGLAVLSTARSPYVYQSVQWLAVLFTYAVLLYLLVSFITEWDHIAVLAAALLGMGL